MKNVSAQRNPGDGIVRFIKTLASNPKKECSYILSIPSEPLNLGGLSWLVQNVRLENKDRFNLGDDEPNWPAKRIRIPASLASELEGFLKNNCGISKETVYERCDLNR